MAAQNTRNRARLGTMVAAPALIAVLALTGCGVSVQGAGAQLDSADALRQQEAQEAQLASAADLPVRPNGVVQVSGTVQASLTSEAAQDFNESGTTTSVSVSNGSETDSFAALCEGTLDLVDSSRSITEEEWQACADNGLEVVQFQIASDALVLATKSETDIGGDCLTLDEVTSLYKSGSSVTNWRQLGFGDYSVDLYGPEADSSTFQFFSHDVLGSNDPTLLNVTERYHSDETEAETRSAITGDEDDDDAITRLASRAAVVKQLRAQYDDARDVYLDAVAEVTEAEAQRQKGIEDNRSEEQQAADQERQDNSYVARSTALVERNEVKAELDAAKAELKLSTNAQKRVNKLVGNLGMFRLSYYEMFDDQLRPLEISVDGDVSNCIFPSQRSVTNGVYPLSRQLLITTTTAGINRGEVSEFLTYFLDQSQSLAEDQRMVPLPDVTVSQEKSWLAGATPTLVTFGESTETSTTAPQPAE